MIGTLSNKLFISLLIAASFGSVAFVSHAQGANGSVDGNTVSSGKEQQKLRTKAARQQALAKKNGELKKLEESGYSPGQRDDSRYPQDLQSAEKKAATGTGASH